MTLTKERTVAFRDKTWSEKAQEILPQLLDDISIPRLIDFGIDNADGKHYITLSSLISDEESEEEDRQYQEHRETISKLAASLPATEREVVEDCLEKMAIIFCTKAGDAADKMADILFRFYLRHHLGFQIPLRANGSAQPEVEGGAA